MPESPLIQAAREHFYIYLLACHKTDMPEVSGGAAVPAEHHKQMIDALTNDALGHTLIVTPRGSGKTTLVQAFLEWTLGRASLRGDKDWAQRTRILYLSHAAHRAFSVSLAVMQTVEGNEVYHAIFPKVKPSPRKWSEQEWRVKGNDGTPHPNFQAGGIDSPPLGGRFDLIVLDDIADEKNMGTGLQREKVITTLEQTIYPMLSPWGRLLMPCTRWAWEDPANWAIEHGWHTVYMKATVRHEVEEECPTRSEEGACPGHSYWPERFPMEKLDKIKSDIGPRAYAKQYDNEVAPEEGLAFERWWLQRRFDHLPPGFVLRIVSWDLASARKKKSSYSVGLPMWVTLSCPLCNGAPWHILIPHMFRAKLPYGYLKVAMRDVYDLMGGYSENHYMVVEKKSVGEALEGEGLHEGTKLYPVRYRDAVGGGQALGIKEEYIRNVTDVCRQGRVHLPSDEYLRQRVGSADWLPPFEKELFSWPESDHDDIVSAFVQGVLEIEERRMQHQRLLMSPREPVPWGESQEVRAVV